MNNSIKQSGKNIALVCGGTLLLAFAIGGFILPHQLVVGGVAGLALSLSPLLSIPTNVVIPIISWSLFLAGWIILGHRFAAKTLLSTLFFPLGIAFFSALPIPKFPLTISALFGGFLIGSGCAMAFLGGGSSGGVDIAALIICKFFPRLKRHQALFLLDAFTILLGALVLRDLTHTLLGILSAFTAALALDYILKMNKK